MQGGRQLNRVALPSHATAASCGAARTDPDLLSATPEFKERSGHDVFRIVVVPAQPICMPEDAITMQVIQHTECVALALNTPVPQPLFALSHVPHAL